MIERLIAENEGRSIEFKETTRSLSGIIRTVVAFANTAGGTIIIGVKDQTKEIIGISDILQEEERLANAISDSISPLLTPDIAIHSIHNKELLVINVPHVVGPNFIKSEGPEKGVYVRFGSTNRIVDSETLAALRLLAANISFDALPNPKGKLDHDLMKETFEKINKHLTEVTKENLGILSNRSGKLFPTNGGILLFDSNRLLLFPDALIRCARFLGTSKEKILDHIDIGASPIHGIDQAIAFIERNVRREAKIGRIVREDILEYPPFAIREAIINACLHADYAMGGCHIQIAIFSDRIEFTNPGGLPFGQTLEKALSGASRLRNHVLGRVFRELGFIEQWGSGLRRIFDTCKRQGLKRPMIEELNNQFRLTLYSSQVEEITIEPWGKILLQYLKEEGSISPKDAAKVWKVTTRTARTRLKSLLDDGFLVRIGASEKDPRLTYVPSRLFL